MKILAIGNSFSEDSTKYLHDFALADGVALKVVNLYIGGCCLERHWLNVLENRAEYEYQLNGIFNGRFASIAETLAEEAWDIVTIQQCSGLSGVAESYEPYASQLAEFVRSHVPCASLMVHQTWAYETDSTHEQFELYGNDQQQMHQALTRCYRELADRLQAPIIPFGEVIRSLRALPPFDYAHGGKSLCRDGFHMHEVYGRYALAATWHACVVGGDIRKNPYEPPVIDGVKADAEELETIRATVQHVLRNMVE